MGRFQVKATGGEIAEREGTSLLDYLIYIGGKTSFPLTKSAICKAIVRTDKCTCYIESDNGKLIWTHDYILGKMLIGYHGRCLGE